ASEWSKFISDIQQNSKLSQLQREELEELSCRYSNTFSNNPGCTDLAEHDIELESDRPIVAKPYRMSPRQIDILRTEVNRMIELKIVESGESDFTSPLILVEVPGKDARHCIDYRKLNKMTRTQYFPLPNIEELIEKVSAAKYISALDLTRGYWKIPLSLSASFVNDFAQAYVKYLGHLVGQGLRQPAELKVQYIKDFPTPTTKTQVRAFLGLAGYYRRYIPEFSVITAPLTDLLKGKIRKSTVDWNETCQKAFDELKDKLKENPVLYSPDFTKPFIVQCDASHIGVGVVLSQINGKEEEHPIMFLSKTFSKNEQNYSTTERECASIIFAVQKLRCYLDAHQKCVIQTDHNPLVWLDKDVGTNPRLLRWA
ncbi:Retrovirus-related Pol polyprotein from transposon gypsy, partial [Araneus ventricosus]